MMFQSQNRETIKEHLKRCCVLQRSLWWRA